MTNSEGKLALWYMAWVYFKLIQQKNRVSSSSNCKKPGLLSFPFAWAHCWFFTSINAWEDMGVLTFVPLLFDVLAFRSLNSANILLQLFEKETLFLIKSQILFVNRVRVCVWVLGCGPRNKHTSTFLRVLGLQRFKFLSRLFQIQSTENKLLFVLSK